MPLLFPVCLACMCRTPSKNKSAREVGLLHAYADSADGADASDLFAANCRRYIKIYMGVVGGTTMECNAAERNISDRV